MSKSIEFVKSLSREKCVKFTPKSDPILLKLYPDPHPLSVEEQRLFVRLTENVFGYNEQLRNDALKILSKGYNLKALAPYLIKFIQDAVEVNLVSPNLSLLIYSIRMAKGILTNPNLELKPFLHLLIPPILSCVICRKISKYNYDNHWTLRDFSSQIIATIIKKFDNSINNIGERIIKVYLKGLEQGDHFTLTCIYGCIKGLGALGDDTVKTFIIPKIVRLNRIITDALNRNRFLENAANEMKCVKYTSDAIVTTAGPVLLKIKNCDDGGTSYVEEFGYLGFLLYKYVKNLERKEAEQKNNVNLYLYCTNTSNINN